jgi:hypothetical protein
MKEAIEQSLISGTLKLGKNIATIDRMGLNNDHIEYLCQNA